MVRLEPTERDGRTLVEWIVGSIGKRIAAGELAPGCRLPSIRELAATSSVSKFTVVEAYDRLVAQGLVTSRPKTGFYVVGQRAALDIAAVERPAIREIDPFWIMRQSLIPDQRVLKPGCGWLPESWLAEAGLRRALRALARAPEARLSEYGHPLGFRPLREQLAIMFTARGVEVGPERILLTDSGSQAIDLANRLLVRPGDTVFVDDPCYFNFQANLRVHGAVVVGIPYRLDGPDLEIFAAEAASRRPRLYITNAAPHNPTGGKLSPAVAHRLLTIAEQHDMAIIEDDIFAEFDPSAVPRLAALDQLNRVVYCGSFSKTLSAATRCGYIVARADWLERLTDLKLATSFGNSETSAQLVHRLLVDGSYRKHVDAIRDRLRVAALQVARQLQECGLSLWPAPSGGLFLWAMLPDGVDSADLARRALAEGIVLAPGNVFSVSQSAGRYLRFNVAQSRHQRLFEFLRGALRA